MLEFFKDDVVLILAKSQGSSNCYGPCQADTVEPSMSTSGLFWGGIGVYHDRSPKRIIPSRLFVTRGLCLLCKCSCKCAERANSSNGVLQALLDREREGCDARIHCLSGFPTAGSRCRHFLNKPFRLYDGKAIPRLQIHHSSRV